VCFSVHHTQKIFLRECTLCVHFGQPGVVLAHDVSSYKPCARNCF